MMHGLGRFARALVPVAVAAGAMLAVMSPQALAQTVRVQSGEHAEFTRLVLDIGAGRSWQLDPLGDTVRLRLDPPVDGFDISRVFDLIPRTRLAGLAVRDGLELTLACPCDIDASRYERRYLVLDIRPATDAALRDARRDAAARLPDMSRLLLGQTPALAPPDRPVMPDPDMSDVSDAGGQGIDLEQAARIMSEQLARAAAAGLLDASAGRPLTDADPTARPPAEATDQTMPQDQVMPTVPPGVQVRAETAFDMVLPMSVFVQAPRDDLACRGEVWAINDWSGGGPVQEGLGDLRRALFDDRDQLQRDGVLALARHYIVSGFGAEAIFWLGEIEAPPPVLTALASLVDEMPGQHFPPEPALLSCSDDELLWRYLDGALDRSALTVEEAGRIQRATAALPDSLRDHIAPRIARILHADGFANEARNLRDMLWRGGALGAGALLWLDRDLGLSMTDVAATRNGLTLALRDSAGEPVAAMAHAMRYDREIGVPVSRQRLDAAEALLREQGIGPATAALWQEVVLARAALGDLDRMLELLAVDTLPEGARDDALTVAFAERAALGDTPALYVLARVFGAQWQASGSEAGRARLAAIAHLRDVGLTDAVEILRSTQRTLILPGRPDSDADQGDPLRDAWQSGDWSRLGDLADGPHRSVADRMMATGTTPADPVDRDLPRLVDALADSSALRDEIEALLAAPRPVPAGALP